MNLAAIDEQAVLARESGFIAAADRLEEKARVARTLAIAYEHYRYVTQEQIDAFQGRLKRATTRKPTIEEIYASRSPRSSFVGLSDEQLVRYATPVYDHLVLDNLEAYEGLPPVDVMLKVKEARSRGIFNGFQVAHVQPVATRIVLPDPIVFGCVQGCTDRFFVAEWGTDVRLADLVGPNGG